MARTPVFSSGNAEINALLWGYKWEFTAQSYSMPTDTSGYGGYVAINGFATMNTAALAPDIAKVIQNYNDVCGLNITLGSGVTTLRYAHANSINVGAPDGRGLHTVSTAEAIVPDPGQFPTYAHGDTWFSNTFTDANPGTFYYAAWLLHETGHAEGLKHGHTSQGTHDSIVFPALPANHDSQEYSIMTYHRFVGGPLFGDLNSDYPTTLMQDDIATLQYLYGADYTTRSTNTVYKWDPFTGHSFINGVDQGGHAHGNTIFQTIWDGGGIDTYDMSNYTSAVKIDLRPGAWSTTSHAQLADLDQSANPGVHLARGNIANALLFGSNTHSLIENARGGAGSDTIYGNQVKNTLYGNGGNDVLYGFQGNDIIAAGIGRDTIDGGLGVDSLKGDSGPDTFIYRSILDSGTRTSTADIIRDFNPVSGANHDVISLRLIDAIPGGADNKFSFIDHHAFTHAGQVRYTYSGSSYTYVWLNTDADASAESMIRLAGHKILDATDFLL